MAKSYARMIRSLERGLVKHGPALLTLIGIGGMFTAGVMAVKATPKAMEDIEDKKEEINQELIEQAEENGEETPEPVEKLHPVDILKTTWKTYAPAVALATLSSICILGGVKVQARQLAAVGTTLEMTRNAFTDYKEETKEVVGEKKEEEIRDRVAKRQLERKPLQDSEVLITGMGETLCLDSASGRYFKSDIEKIRRVENEMNFRLRDEMYVSLNDFWWELGLKSTDLGEDNGWNIDDGPINLYFSSQLADNGQPCLVVSYDLSPKFNYGSLL